MRLFLKALILPPAGNFFAIVAALALWRFYPRVAKILLIAAIGSLWLFSTPWVSDLLIGGLENNYAALSPTEPAVGDAEAIVILSGGRRIEAPDFGGGEVISSSTLERTWYGALLHRRTDLPILVTGGRVMSWDERSLADLMSEALEQGFEIPVRWRETRSRNTWQNAQYSREILQAEQIDTVVLVTHAWHMPRAVGAFEAVGFDVVPAPMGHRDSNRPLGIWSSWLPNTTALDKTRDAFHEWLGRLYYALAY